MRISEILYALTASSAGFTRRAEIMIFMMFVIEFIFMASIYLIFI